MVYYNMKYDNMPGPPSTEQINWFIRQNPDPLLHLHHGREGTIPRSKNPYGILDSDPSLSDDRLLKIAKKVGMTPDSGRKREEKEENLMAAPDSPHTHSGRKREGEEEKLIVEILIKPLIEFKERFLYKEVVEEINESPHGPLAASLLFPELWSKSRRSLRDSEWYNIVKKYGAHGDAEVVFRDSIDTLINNMFKYQGDGNELLNNDLKDLEIPLSIEIAKDIYDMIIIKLIDFLLDHIKEEKEKLKKDNVNPQK